MAEGRALIFTELSVLIVTGTLKIFTELPD
jgi:hypothetical protein